MKELRELAEAATPGPWLVGDTRARGQEVWIDTRQMDPRLNYQRWDGLIVAFGCDEQPVEGAMVAQANAAYIAAANPQTVLRLLDVADAAKRAMDSNDGDTMGFFGKLADLRTALEALEKDQ